MLTQMLWIRKASEGKIPHSWHFWNIKIPKPPYISSIKIIGSLHFLKLLGLVENNYLWQSFWITLYIWKKKSKSRVHLLLPRTELCLLIIRQLPLWLHSWVRGDQVLHSEVPNISVRSQKLRNNWLFTKDWAYQLVRCIVEVRYFFKVHLSCKHRGRYLRKYLR